MTTPPDPYGAPPPPPGYGPPAFPAYPQGQPGEPEPSKALAITAFVLSFIGCLIVPPLVAIVLAVVVLRRGRDGRRHGKGLAIAALVISVVTLAISVVAYVGIGLFAKDLTDVNSLSKGECITASGLSDDSQQSIGAIRTVSCSDEHDGEVAQTTTLTQDQLDGLDSGATTAYCQSALGSLADGLSLVAITPPDATVGDRLACVVYDSDGSPLTGPLG